MDTLNGKVRGQLSGSPSGALFALSAEVWALITVLSCLPDVFSLGLTCKHLADATRGERLREICVSDRAWDSMVEWQNLENLIRAKENGTSRELSRATVSSHALALCAWLGKLPVVRQLDGKESIDIQSSARPGSSASSLRRSLGQNTRSLRFSDHMSAKTDKLMAFLSTGGKSDIRSLTFALAGDDAWRAMARSWGAWDGDVLLRSVHTVHLETTGDPQGPIFSEVVMPALRTIDVGWNHISLLQGSLEVTLPGLVSVYVGGYNQEEAQQDEYDTASVILGHAHWKEVLIREDAIWREIPARASRNIRRQYLTENLPVTTPLRFI
ncbi:hypothetical protein BD626DRAFT_564275 [Schizophyllum amplum]|uniref:F-box domain-containing protein n=1 Tax=Schizophyllum amplum TaxID=97359 RepID=A0A550D0V4_9AGAR|nr:hypothetical protein BD626DRAFT_564275 [Auriculariopsis ampla]